MKNAAQTFMLVSSMLLGLVVPPCRGGMVEGLLCLIPAAIGSYGTYKTLAEEPSFFGALLGHSFSKACKKFSQGMSQIDPQDPSTVTTALFVNFDKYFKSHEKMALIGNFTAILVGATLQDRRLGHLSFCVGLASMSLLVYKFYSDC